MLLASLFAFTLRSISSPLGLGQVTQHSITLLVGQIAFTQPGGVCGGHC